MNLSKLAERTSVAVIGAGPAGAFLALHLARRKVDVTLFEKACLPRSKVCGCCLSARAIRELDDAGLSSILAEARAVDLHTLRLKTKTKEIPMPLTRGAAISRAALDWALVDAAKSAGAKVFDSVAATVEQVKNGLVHLRLNTGSDVRSLAARIVVVADGLSGTTLKYMPDFRQNSRDGSRVGTGAISLDQNCPVEAGVIYMSYAPGGYAGLVRLEDGAIDIAAALDPQFLRQFKEAPLAVAEILRKTKAPVPADVQTIEWRGTVSLTRQRAVASERIFVIGDAASYVEPFTGEGISLALTSATILAPLAERASLIWHPSLIEQWSRLHKEHIARRQSDTAKIAWLLKQNFRAELCAQVLHTFPVINRPLMNALTGVEVN